MTDDAPTSTRRIDHLVLAVRDLDVAADLYGRLGFQVGPRNRHPWGTENRLVQFRSSFLELITVGSDPGAIPPHGPGRFSFGAFVQDYLDRREGCAMLVLDSSDARTDAEAFAQARIGRFEPFFFERKGLRPDGGEIQVAFTLAFAMNPGLPDAAFFVCEQHNPEAFWNAAFQRHPNGATDVRAVTLSVAKPADHVAFLSGFTGVAGRAAGRGGMMFPLRHGGGLLAERRGGATGLTAFAVAVPDLGQAADGLVQAGVRFGGAGAHLTVAAEDAFGVEVHLVPTGPQSS